MKKEDSLSETMPLGNYFNIASKLYYGAFVKKVEHLDMERNFSMLLIIEMNPGCSQQFLADALNVDKASMVRMTNYLLERGYIRRIVNPEDRREQLLQLTEKAQAELPEIQSVASELNATALHGLTKSEIAVFYKALAKVQSNLKSLPATKVIFNYKTAK